MNDMARVVLKGPLSNIFGREEIEINSNNLIELLSRLDERSIIIAGSKVRPGYLILVNGVDFRLLSDLHIRDTDVVEILPVNHGG